VEGRQCFRATLQVPAGERGSGGIGRSCSQWHAAAPGRIVTRRDRGSPPRGGESNLRRAPDSSHTPASCRHLQGRYPHARRNSAMRPARGHRQSLLARALMLQGPGGTTAAASPVMPRDSRGAQPDPTAREVDRLLAQLASTARPSAPPSTPAPTSRRRVTRVSSAEPASRAEQIGLWARVALGATLGGLITQWPYSHGCGVPLAGYLGAVAMVLVAGIWIAAVSWRHRSGAAHTFALLLLWWGTALAAERVLPRVGYAAERASWACSPDPSF
jgi:hypothetical protein